MLEIDPRRLDLAREFRARPFGVHSPDLQAVLNRMRGAPSHGKYCLLMSKPHAEWLLARMTGDPLRPEVVPGCVYDNHIARLTTNVLRRFADPAPFDLPPGGK